MHSLWAGDSLLARPLFDPLVTLATAAAVTTTTRLGTGVLLAPMRQPALTAQAIGSLDQLSGGRLILGVGRGFDLPESRREFAAAGVDFEDRTRRLDQTLAFWRDLWGTEGRASLDEPYSRVDNEAIQPQPAREGGPPIWLAGFGEAAFTRTARIADGWLPYPPNPHEYRRGWDRIISAATLARRDPDSITPAVMMTINIGPRASSLRNLEAYAHDFYGYPLDLVETIQACCAGPPDEIIAYLRDFWDAGARTFVLRLASIDDPHGQLDAAAESILPEVATWQANAA